MTGKQQKLLHQFEQQKKSGETIEFSAPISGRNRILLYLVVGIFSFFLGRIFVDKIAVLMLTNLISMWMMADVARVLMYTQDSCILVTDRRIYGRIHQKEFNIFYRNIREIRNSRQGIYINGGNAHDRILLRFLPEKELIYQKIAGHHL